MNSIQIKNKIDFYNNISKNARYYRFEYDDAFNIATIQYINSRMGDQSKRTPEMYQQIRDDIYTLEKVATVTFTPGTAITNRYYEVLPATGPVPSDYLDFGLLMCLIDGYTTYARPTDNNELGPLFENSFMHPSNDKPYFAYSTTGFKLYRSNSGTLTSATLTYLKFPATFTIGLETQLINTGGVLTNAAVYYATEQSVYAGTTYAIGATITGTGAALTSGQVILASNTATSDLPPKAQDDLCLMASKIMLGVVRDFQASAFSEKEANETD